MEKKVILFTQPNFANDSDELKGQIYYTATPNQLATHNKAHAKREKERESNPDLPKAGMFLNPNLNHLGFIATDYVQKGAEVIHRIITKDGYFDRVLGKIDSIIKANDRTKEYGAMHRQKQIVYSLVTLFSLLFVAPVFSQDFKVVEDEVCQKVKRKILLNHNLKNEKVDAIRDGANSSLRETGRVYDGISNAPSFRITHSTTNESLGTDLFFYLEYTRKLITEEGYCRVTSEKIEEAYNIQKARMTRIKVDADTMWIYPDPTFKGFMQWKLDRL